MHITQIYCIILLTISDTKGVRSMVEWLFAVILWMAALASASMAGSLFEEAMHRRAEGEMRSAQNCAMQFVGASFMAIIMAYAGLQIVQP